MTTQVVPLASVADVVMGQSPPSSTYNNNGKGLPFFQGKADFGELYPVARMFCTNPSRIAEAGDILISVRAPVGPTNVAEARSCIGRGLAALRPGNDLDSRYLLYYLRYREPRIARMGVGSTFDAIDREDLETIPVFIPELREQKRIADFLQHADWLCRIRRYALELSEDFLSTEFVSLFGNPVHNPKGFRVERLEDLIDPRRPVTYGILKPGPHIADGVPYIRVVDIADGSVVAAQVRRTSHSIDKAYRRSTLKAGDLLLSIRGEIGRLGIVPSDLDGANITQDTARLAPIADLEPAYLMGCLASRPIQRLIAQWIKGSAVKGINLGDVKELPLPVPPRPLQTRFAELTTAHRRMRVVQRESLRQADHLLASLMRTAFADDSSQVPDQHQRN